MTDAPSPEHCTVRARLDRPESREALRCYAEALEDAEFLCGPSASLLGGGTRNRKRESQAPEGDRLALGLLRAVIWKAEHARREVANFRAPLSPEQLRQIKEYRRRKREERTRARLAVASAIRTLPRYETEEAAS